MLARHARCLSLSKLLLPRAKPLVPREHREPPPPLPEPKQLDIHGRCRLEYVDVAPSQAPTDGGQRLTMVMVHGAPGQYQDFKHLIPVLQQSHPHARLLAVTLPGFGGSQVLHAPETSDRYYDEISALPSARLTLQALEQLCPREHPLNHNVFLIGHSFGGHTALNLAALNLLGKPSGIDVKGIALLASAGCRPHRVLRPRSNALLVRVLRARPPLLAPVLPGLVKEIYTKLLQFASHAPPEHYVAGVVRAGTTDFNVVREHVELLRRARLPALMAWSRSDEYMEREIPEELAEIGPPGPRLAFVGGGHNIQKTRAEQLAAALRDWTDAVLADRHLDAYSDTQTSRLMEVQVLP